MMDDEWASSRGEHRFLSEINVTPLVDVMLVLLVIFIVTAPLLHYTIPLQLPRTTAHPGGMPAQSLAIALDRNGHLYLNGQEIHEAALGTRLKTLARPGSQVQLSVDATQPYARVARIMALIQNAGIHRLNFLTLPQPAKP